MVTMVVLVLNCKVCNKLFTKDHLVAIVVVNIVNTRTKGNMDPDHHLKHVDEGGDSCGEHCQYPYQGEYGSLTC